MKMENITIYLSSDDGLSGVYSMDKFLVRAYSQRAREVNGGAGGNSWEFGGYLNVKSHITKVLSFLGLITLTMLCF